MPSNMLLLLLPPPRELRDKPEVSLPLDDLQEVAKISGQQQQRRSSLSSSSSSLSSSSFRSMVMRLNEAAQVKKDEMEGERRRVGINGLEGTPDRKEEENAEGAQEFEKNIMNVSTKRLTGDRWSSDRSGNIFLRSRQRQEVRGEKKEKTAIITKRAAFNEEANHSNQLSSLSPAAVAGLQQHQSVKMMLDASFSHEQEPEETCCLREPFQNSPAPTLIGRLQQQSAIWTTTTTTKQAPISKFIGSSASPVCLLLSASTKLLLQLMWIIMLITFPLSLAKCPSVTVAMAAHQNHHHHHHQPPPPSAAAATTITKDTTRASNQMSLNSITPYKLPTNKLYQESSPIKQLHTWSARQQKEQHKFSSITRAAAAAAAAATGQQKPANNEDDMDPSRAGSSSGSQPPNRKRFKRASYDQNEQQQQPLGNCNQFSAFWNFFRGTYPSLASHLLSLATIKGENHLLAQTSKTISRLLDEAERLVRLDQQQAAGGRAEDRGASSVQARPTMRPPGSAASAWLARVKANPLYNRIIQHFQNQHRHLADRQSQNLHDLSASAKLSASGQNQQQQQQQQQELQLDNGQKQLYPPLPSDDSHVYGRVIHFPHEANNEASKTLDKLKQLSQQQQAASGGQQQQRQTNEIDRTAGVEAGGQVGSGDQIESNGISLMAGDGEPWPDATGQQRHHVARLEPDSDAADSARNKYVYGDVLLRPSQKNQAQAAQHNLQTNNQHHRHGGSLGALRQLSNDLDRSMRLDEQPAAQTEADDTKKLAQQHQQDPQFNEPTSESYGRVLVSPPNYADRTIGERIINGLLTDKDEMKAMSISDKLGHQLGVGGGDGASSRGLNELAAQHYGDSVAAASAPDEPGNEFEGVWYSGPLQQIEVRQLRSGDADRTKGAAEPETIVRTTSNPKQAFVVN